MASKLKPYSLEAKKQEKRNLSETDIFQWSQVILANLRAEPDWTEFAKPGVEWQPKSTANRGFSTDNPEERARKLDKMLADIATYSPVSLSKEIINRSCNLKRVWKEARKWALVRASSSKQLTYFRLKQSYDPSGPISHQEFYYNLRDAMEESLLKKCMIFKGKVLVKDEELTATAEAQVVLDWLFAVGGNPLVETVFTHYAQDLETKSLKYIQERISFNMSMLSN